MDIEKCVGYDHWHILHICWGCKELQPNQWKHTIKLHFYYIVYQKYL